MQNDDIFGDLITPERRAKGDVSYQLNAAGHIRHAQVRLRTVMNFLWERGVLDDQHVHDGQMYELWQTCFSAFLGYRNSPIYRGELTEARTALAEDRLSEGAFEKLIRRLTLPDKHAVESAIYTHANTEHQRWLAYRNSHAYRSAFDRLSDTMTRQRELAAPPPPKENACADDRFR